MIQYLVTLPPCFERTTSVVGSDAAVDIKLTKVTVDVKVKTIITIACYETVKLIPRSPRSQLMSRSKAQNHPYYCLL